jgi:hypothetical protein
MVNKRELYAWLGAWHDYLPANAVAEFQRILAESSLKSTSLLPKLNDNEISWLYAKTRAHYGFSITSFANAVIEAANKKVSL